MNENHQPDVGAAPVRDNRTLYCLVSESAIQQQEHSISATNTHFSPTFHQNGERSRGTWDRLPACRFENDRLEAYPTSKIGHLLTLKLLISSELCH